MKLSMQDLRVESHIEVGTNTLVTTASVLLEIKLSVSMEVIDQMIVPPTEQIRELALQKLALMLKPEYLDEDVIIHLKRKGIHVDLQTLDSEDDL